VVPESDPRLAVPKIKLETFRDSAVAADRVGNLTNKVVSSEAIASTIHR
jgi:hypothetical protein